MLQWCHSHRIALSVRHIPSKLNKRANNLTWAHSALHVELSICSQGLPPVFDPLFTPMVDLSNSFQPQFPICLLPVWDPAAWAVNAFLISWSGFLAYAFPPLPILGWVEGQDRAGWDDPHHPKVVLAVVIHRPPRALLKSYVPPL